MSTKKIFFHNINEGIKIYNFTKNSYKKIGEIGKGTFSKVFLVDKIAPQNEEDSNRFCLKVNKRYDFIEEVIASENKENSQKHNINVNKANELSSVEMRELMILKKISNYNHPNLIKFIDVHFEKREIWILMEYLPTDLEKFFALNSQNPQVMNEHFFKSIAYQCINGLCFLHKLQIMHRDIKPSNIFYDDKKNIVKIGDFGLSRTLSYDVKAKYTLAGTYAYNPPDILLGSLEYSSVVDVWSLGCVLVEICTNKNLFGKSTQIGVLKLIYQIYGSFNQNILPGYDKFPNSNLIMNLPEKNGMGLINYIKTYKKFEFENENFYDLIEKMLCIDPSKRINAYDCLNHPWFKDFKLN